MPSLIVFGLLIAYGVGAWKFWSGFNRTNFTSNRLLLTAGWPLFLLNPSYRQNFNRALKG
jgi:hypothetical protein